MADIIEAGIIIIVVTDIDPDIITLMVTDIIMDVVIELLPDVMGIIGIEMTTITVVDIEIVVETITTEVIITIGVITITEVGVITTELPDHVHKREDTDRSLKEARNYSSLYYPAILSKTFPTINPPNVPTIYPIIAMSTPMGIRALE